jgi:serine/threonine protein kinase/Tfp pilus assembly protein PilF
MTPERWRRVEEIFEAALAEPIEQRENFLDQACGSDIELRSQIAAMLAADEAESSLDSSIGNLAAMVFVTERNESDENIGRRVGNYKIVREIGRGGMGAVYEAIRDDAEFHQRVALKLIKRGMDTDFILRRFRQERQILANLNHPFIARLFDGGTTEDGLPYFVMENVEGLPVDQYCARNELSLDEKLRLFVRICIAVAYAHKVQIVHRDIKPANILVTDGGEVKLLDFGIAKILNNEQPNETVDSVAGRLMMTPKYASPEQVRGQPATPASDIYSLGVLLYELLTGKYPFELAYSETQELARAICEDMPLLPSTVLKNEQLQEKTEKNRENRNLDIEEQIGSELDRLVLKALRKNPNERYVSAAEFAAEIERLLSGQTPIAGETFSADVSVSTVREKTIAVLPFKVFNYAASIEDTDSSFLGIGLTDALITRLSNVRSFMMRPTGAVIKYADADGKEIFAAGRELHTTFVLDGRIALDGKRLRVTVQLISIEDKSTLWAQQYNENFTDIFDVQDSISEQVALALETELTDTERQNLAKRGTKNPAAYEAYLRGRAKWHSYSEEGISQAIGYFRQAIEIDPHFAAAHSGIADLHVALGIISVIPPIQAFGIAKESARRAVELDSNLAEAYAALGFATLAFDWDATESERLFRKSFALNDNFAPAHEWFAHVLGAQGRFDEAIAEMKRALRIDPRSSQLNSMTAYIYHNARRHREGVKFIERALELEPNNYLALQGFGWMYPPLGKGKEAIRYCQRAVEISNRAPLCLWVLGQVLAGEDEKEEARKILEELKEMQSERYVSPYYFGMLCAALGEDEEAFRWLEKTIDDHVYWAHWFAAEYRLDRLREDARYKKLLERFDREKSKKLSNFDLVK